MKTTKTLILLSATIAISSFFTSCSKDKGCTDPVALNFDKKAETDDGSCIYPTPTPTPTPSTEANVAIDLDHFFNGVGVSSTNFNQIIFTNAFGNNLSISKVRYLLSNFKFHRGHPHHDTITINDFKLVDLSVPGSDVLVLSQKLPKGDYEGLSFTLGFIPTDNISNFYPSLNSVNWNWPAALGGGYHYLQLEGQFVDSSSATVNYAYHWGTAREITVTNDTIFHPNFGNANLANNAYTISADDVEFHLFVNLDQWFENPNTWDLNVYNTMLMPNFQAQQLMQQNSATVFEFDHLHN
ncbi:MAG: hypothetical protein RQ875_02180 [Vicingaceae bacterium]|nr:hypothetical protein [Vicingaceae bacterium]